MNKCTYVIYDADRNDLPVPLRSPHSLKVSESPYEPMYVTPNRKRFGEFVSYVLKYILFRHAHHSQTYATIFGCLY